MRLQEEKVRLLHDEVNQSNKKFSMSIWINLRICGGLFYINIYWLKKLVSEFVEFAEESHWASDGPEPAGGRK